MFHNNFKFNNFLPKTIPKYALLRLWTCSIFDKRGNSKSWNKWVTCLSWNKSDVMHTTYISKAMAQTKSIPYPRPSLWHGFFPLCIFIVPRSELNLGNGRWCRNWHGAYTSWVVVKKENFFWDAYWRLQNGLIPTMNGRLQVLLKRERLIMNGEPACRSMIWAPMAVGGREIMGLARLLRH